MENKVSIVTVSYNAVNSIERTINSVIQQDYTNWEYIIVDGGSNDGTLDIINKYKGSIKTIISEQDRGVYDAMNKALYHLDSDWVLFLNAGDVLYDHQTLKNIFDGKSYNGKAAIYGNWLNNNRGVKKVCRPDAFYRHEKYTYTSGICHQAIFINTSLQKQVPFDLSYKYCADYDSFVRIYRLNPQFYYIDATISEFDTSYGMSALNRLSVLKECRQISGRGYSCEYFCLYLKYSLKKVIRKVLNK